MKRRWIQLTGVGIAVLIAAVWLTGCQKKTNTSTVITPPPPEVADSVIVLEVGHGPKPRHQHLRTAIGMSVAWSNTDTVAHTVKFTDWPFDSTKIDIDIAAGTTSNVFHINKQLPPGKYKYGIFPPVKGDTGAEAAANTGPPDPPDIVADP